MHAPTNRGPLPRPRLWVVSAQRPQEAVASGPYEYIGRLMGVAGACAAFFGAYFAAISSNGWVIGLALGWVTAWLAAAVAFILLRRLWPVLVVLLISLLR